jgi:DNA-binding response OmpR family regulator
MTIPVLVVDADDEYRGLTAKTLDGSGQYQAIPAESAKTALALFSASRAQIAIIDTDLKDMEIDDLIGQLIQQNKHLLIIAVVEEQNSESDRLISLGVRSILQKPYFLPKLPTIINSAVHGTSAEANIAPQLEDVSTPPENASPDEIPEWLTDPDQAKDFLTRLFEEHSAQALLLIRGTTLWAWSAQLTEEYAQQIASNVLDHDRGAASNESIVGYIRIKDLESEFLLYAIPLHADFKLIMLYDSEKSFSFARRQAKYVSSLILTQDPDSLPTPEPDTQLEETATPSAQPQDTTLPSDWIPQSPASVEDFPQLTEVDIPPADPEISSLEEAAIATPDGLDIPSLPTDWFPKRPTPSSHLPFLSPDEENDPSSEDSDTTPEGSS